MYYTTQTSFKSLFSYFTPVGKQWKAIAPYNGRGNISDMSKILWEDCHYKNVVRLKEGS